MGEVALVAQANGLDERQARFVELVVAGTDPEEAKDQAGYAKSVPTVVILRGKLVQNAIRDWGDAQLRGPMLVKSLRKLEELLDSKSAQVALGAVKLVLDQAKEAEDGDDDRPLSELSIEELERVIARKEAELKDVTPKNGA